jgi:hypothetical protein
MDGFHAEALRRLPLAESGLRVWAWLTEESFLAGLFQRYRGRSYDKVLSFPILVYLIALVLLHHRGSGRAGFAKAREDGGLPASVEAAFGKLRRLPIALSMGFLADCTVRLLELFPDHQRAIVPPASVAEMEVVLLDGKAIKRVAKRLKPLRGAHGGVLGGRALVAYWANRGVVVAMHAHADGQVNDVRFVPDLLPRVRGTVSGPRLFVGDRQFCNLEHLPGYLAQGDHFLIRYHANVQFTPDPSRPEQHGLDHEGRTYRQEWGWLGGVQNRGRRLVRRITLQRPDAEAVAVVTDLGAETDAAARYPAVDVLAVYLARWDIERVFQQVTEVFGLHGLIGSSPEATVFQFGFCLVLYNILQLLRAYVAEGAEQPVAEVSTEKLFADVNRQLTAWYELTPPGQTVRLIEPLTRDETRSRLAALLGRVWTERWRKAPKQKRRPPDHTGHRSHNSAYRLIEQARANRSAPKQKERK